jgi:hypothetical protein
MRPGPEHESWLRRAYDQLNFLSVPPTPDLVPATRYDEIFDQIRAMPPDARQVLIDQLARQHERLDRDTESVRARGSDLLTATGVMSGVLALIVPVTTAIHAGFGAPSKPALVLFGIAAIAFLVVIYCGVACVVLAIRSQEPGWSSVVEMRPIAGQSVLAFTLDYAFKLQIAYLDNDSRLTIRVSFLRQAQTLFRTLIQALALLVVVSLVAIAIDAFTSGHSVVQPTKLMPSNASSASLSRPVP